MVNASEGLMFEPPQGFYVIWDWLTVRRMGHRCVPCLCQFSMEKCDIDSKTLSKYEYSHVIDLLDYNITIAIIETTPEA